MRIAIVADHNGVSMKRELAEKLIDEGHQVDDRGSHGDDVVDYPPLCLDACREVAEGRADRAIVLGGTGSGEQVACNKIPGIRASLCHRGFLAEIARAHNDANVLVMGTKVVATDLAARIVDVWLHTEFKGGRHQRRIDQIAALERGEDLT
jgi:ribose 5-phosphate isomerase B